MRKLEAEFYMDDVMNIKFCQYCGSDNLHHISLSRYERYECNNCGKSTNYLRQRKQNTEHLTEYLHHTRYINGKQAYDIEQHIGQVEHDNGEVDKDLLINLGVHRGTAEILERLIEQIEAGDFE